jgi:hypothetical protein
VHERPLGTSIQFARSLLKIVPKDLKEEREALKQRLLELVDELADPNLRMFYSKNKNE